MKFIFLVNLFLLAIRLFAAAPLESGYPLAPRPTASPEEKQRAYQEARNRVISAAMRYENTPYRYGGITAAGLDCSGFICLSFNDALGVNLPRSAAGLYSWVEKIPLERIQPGDLIFFKTDGTGRVTHVGLYLGNRRFIHSASIGSRTGVIINTLDEGSWTRNYAGSGRVFPEAADGYVPVTVNTRTRNSNNSGGWGGLQGSREGGTNRNTRLLAGIAAAPTLDFFTANGDYVVGFNSQLRLAVDTAFFGKRMIFGLELRPQYDGQLGVFRLPITLSWGLNDKLRIFAGPVFDSGTNDWYGIAGLSLSPFILKTNGGEFAPYAEAAWLSNSINNDLLSGLRFSTGLRWTIRVN